MNTVLKPVMNQNIIHETDNIKISTVKHTVLGKESQSLFFDIKGTDNTHSIDGRMYNRITISYSTTQLRSDRPHKKCIDITMRHNHKQEKSINDIQTLSVETLDKALYIVTACLL